MYGLLCKEISEPEISFNRYPIHTVWQNYIENGQLHAANTSAIQADYIVKLSLSAATAAQSNNLVSVTPIYGICSSIWVCTQNLFVCALFAKPEANFVSFFAHNDHFIAMTCCCCCCCFFLFPCFVLVRFGLVLLSLRGFFVFSLHDSLFIYLHLMTISSSLSSYSLQKPKEKTHWFIAQNVWVCVGKQSAKILNTTNRM